MRFKTTGCRKRKTKNIMNIFLGNIKDTKAEIIQKKRIT
jgi:hypothetical protein